MRMPALFTVLAALLVAGAAGAATPRGGAAREADSESPASEIADPVAWSKRLLGRFKFDGVIHHEEIADYSRERDSDVGGEVRGASLYLGEWSQPIEGKGDCIDFAEGPGLQCVMHVVWPEMWREETGKAQLGGVSDLTPAMVLAGFVTSTPGGIRVLMVNDRGLAHPGALTLKGNTALARVPCVNLPGMQVCEQKFTIEARPGSAVIQVTLSARTRFIRSKLDRKQSLDMVGDRRLETPTEWVEELLDVSFSLRRESSAADEAQNPAPVTGR